MRRIIVTKNQLPYQLMKEEREEFFEESLGKEAFLKKMLTEITAYEDKKNELLEIGGLAATPYAGALKNICDYVDIYIKQHNPNSFGVWSIEVPHKYTKSIDIFKKLNLYVDVSVADAYADFGSGVSNIHDNPIGNIENGQWIEETIYITSYCDNHKHLFYETLYNSLIHEINHKFDELKSSLKGANRRISRDAYNLHQLAEQLPFSQDPKTTELIHTILYRLFSSSELNALVASTYGDLFGLKSKRENFLTDREELQSYSIYKYITDNLHLLSEMPNSEWKILRNFLDNNNRKKIGTDDFGIQRYKNSFIRNVTNCLKKLYDGIEQVAATYYGMMSERRYLHELNMLGEKIPNGPKPSWIR